MLAGPMSPVSPLTTSMPAAEQVLLWIYTNPARRVHDSAFYKWHEAERMPALLDIPESLFLSCTRWIAADRKTPTYLSLYDLALRSTVHDPEYIALNEKHALETRRAEFVESRVYEPVDVLCPSPTWTTDSITTDEYAPSRYITVVEADLAMFAESEFCRWYDEEHIPFLSRVPGWVRSRRFVLQEVLGVEATESDQELSGGETEMDSDGGSEGEQERRPEWTQGMRILPDRPPKFLAIHEWTSLDVFETKQYRHATTTPWRTEVLKADRVLRYHIRAFRAS
ncbi:hypothetical protein BD311DRAFT_770169 [Dichomitus squalens]|uniref:EthD domain-containing protein n=1 Tax=Dichomitus squalens TaxID=114155 RepID=A0A4Q9M6F7_9APHY|nr:hypothetical protein BD311DRAFT_770169 [Dichomitus squalens]